LWRLIPMIVVFFLAQRYFIGGIVLMGLSRWYSSAGIPSFPLGETQGTEGNEGTTANPIRISANVYECIDAMFSLMAIIRVSRNLQSAIYNLQSAIA
jgi:hypothetical protein